MAGTGRPGQEPPMLVNHDPLSKATTQHPSIDRKVSVALPLRSWSPTSVLEASVVTLYIHVGHGVQARANYLFEHPDIDLGHSRRFRSFDAVGPEN